VETWLQLVGFSLRHRTTSTKNMADENTQKDLPLSPLSEDVEVVDYPSTQQPNDDNSDEEDDEVLLHEPAVDIMAMRRIMLKEFFVRAFLLRDEPTYTYANFMPLVTVEVSANKEAQFEVSTVNDSTLVDKLLIWFREPAKEGRRPFSTCLIENDRVMLESTAENVKFILDEFFFNHRSVE